MINEKWLIGEWELSSANNTISRSGHSHVLPPRLIDTLLYFARRPNVVISRDELASNVWTRSFVTDQAITQKIFELRKVLRDGRPSKESIEYIKTVNKRGYCLVAPVELLEENETTSYIPEQPAESKYSDPTPEKSASDKVAPTIDEQGESIVTPVTPHHLGAANSPVMEGNDRSSQYWKHNVEENVPASSVSCDENESSLLQRVKNAIWLNADSLGFKKTAY